ncbi:MAG TPA: SDR family NAD(P)-dependent oxidoreductase [Geminicoccaceae bacterium]
MSVLDRFRLDGKRLFITGGSRGLGREMALAIADAGADVVLTGRDPESLERTAAEVRGLGRQAWTLQADLADPLACETVCARALAEYGPLDILINNLGGRRDPTPTEDMPLAQWRALIDLNLTSSFVCTKAIGGAMVRHGRGGRIINIASINAFVAGRGIGGRHYEAAKAAIVQFTRAVAADWAPHSITVNAICPGLFMTEPNQRWARERPDMIAGMRERTPMQTFGAPEDLGPLAVYLASDAARFMTGAALVIDGGYTLW